MWNYRAIKDKNNNFSVGEAYYNKNGNLWGITKNKRVFGNSVDELIDNLKLILSDIEASKHDVIEEDKVVLDEPDFDKDLINLESKTDYLTDEQLDDYCLKDELNCIDHPEFEFIKNL